MTTAYAPRDTALSIAESITDARQSGWTRPALRELTGFTESQIWRAEGGRAQAHEVDAWLAALTKIQEGDVEPPTKPKAERVDVAALEARIRALESVVARLLDAQAEVAA